MAQRATRSSTKVREASQEDVEGWHIYRVEGTVWPGTARELEGLAAATNQKGQTLVREVHGAAKQYRIMLDTENNLFAEQAIPSGTAVGLFFCSVSDAGHSTEVDFLYKQDVLLGGASRGLTLGVQEINGPRHVSGYGNDGFISNFWYATQQCETPNCHPRWTRVSADKASTLWVVVAHASQDLAAGTRLSLDRNAISGNVRGFGTRVGAARPQRMPGGYLGQALMKLYPDRATPCSCSSTCSLIVLDEDLSISELDSAEAQAGHMKRTAAQSPREIDHGDGNGDRLMHIASSSDKRGRKRRTLEGKLDEVDVGQESSARAVCTRRDKQAGPRGSSFGPGMGTKRRVKATRRAGAGKGDKEGATSGLDSGGNLPLGGRGLAFLPSLEQSGNANDQEAEEGVQGFSEMRVAAADTRTETRNLHRYLSQDGHGRVRRNNAGGGISERASGERLDKSASSSFDLSTRGNAHGVGSRNASALSSSVERFRDVRDSSRSLAGGNACFQRSGTSLGPGTDDAGRNAVLDKKFASGCAVSPHGVRISAASKRKAGIQADDEGRRITPRDAAATGHASHAKHASTFAPPQGTNSGAESQRLDHSLGNSTMLSGGRIEATASLRFPSGVRRTVQSTIQERGGLPHSEAQAGSAATGVVSKTTTRLYFRVVHDSENFKDVGRKFHADLYRLQQGSESSSEMSPLSPPVYQRAEGGGSATASIETADLGSGEILTQTDRDRFQAGVGNLYEEGRHFGGDSRTSPRAGSLSAERARSGDCGSGVHGARGPEGPLRDSSRTSTLTTRGTEEALGSMIRWATGYGAGSAVGDNEGEFLETAISRTLLNIVGAQAPGIMAERRSEARSNTTLCFTLATRGGLDVEMDTLLGIRKRKTTQREVPFTFGGNWSVRDEHGEVCRPGMKQTAAPTSTSHGDRETESDEEDEMTAGGGGYDNSESAPG